jgi:hypothetical protein
MTEESQIQLQKNFFSINILSARTIILIPKTPIKREYLDKYHLKNVIFDSNYSLKQNDKIKVNYENSNYETYYKANFIYKEDATRIRINEFEDNVSSSYVLPLLNIKKDYLLLPTNFINCYVNHYNFKHYLGEYAYLIYRYLPISYYAKFIKVLQEQKGCLSYIKDEDKRFDCFVFKIDENYIEDIKLIFDGKFSKINENTKRIIMAFHNQTKMDSPIAQILYKGELRKNELEEYFGCKMPDNIDYAEAPKINEEIWN